MDVGLVCDACSALTPIGVPQCTRCGAAVALDPRPPRTKRQSNSAPPVQVASADPSPDPLHPNALHPPALHPCNKCGTMVTPGQRFCPHCGNRIVIAVNFEVETRVGPRSSGT